MPDVKMPDGTIIRNVPPGTTKAQLMARLAKAREAEQPKDRGILRRIDDVIRGVADTVTLGYSDEISAGLGALTGIGGKRGDYEGNLAAQRARDKEGGTERFAGQIGGAFMLPISKVSAARGAAGVLGSAAEGAAYGAAYGSGSAQGGIRERATAAIPGAALGAAGGAAGRMIGNTVSRALRGRQVSPAVRTLADEGIVMTPGQRGGPIARTYEEGVLGSIPFIKSVPQAAKRRGVEQLNVAAYNRALKPLGARLPMSTSPGKEAVAMVGDTIFSAYDDAAARLALGMDKGIKATATSIKGGAQASAGSSAGQLQAIVDDTLAPLNQGRVTGTRVRDMLQDLRGQASQFATSPVATERRIGDQLWKLHDQMEAAIMRQNKGDVVGPFKAARQAASLFKRVEAAAAKSPDGIFNPQQLRTAVTKRGYGTTTGKLARGTAPMQDLADAAKQVLPATIPNSGTPERLIAAGLLSGGPGVGALVDPAAGALLTAPMISYAPGIDRALQYFALQRPDLFRRGGSLVAGASPYIGTAGALTAAGQGR